MTAAVARRPWAGALAWLGVATVGLDTSRDAVVAMGTRPVQEIHDDFIVFPL